MDKAQLKAFVRAQYPRCPGMYVDEIAERLVRRQILPALAAREIEAMAEAVIRHQLTDYDLLRTRHSLAPEEARASVADEIADWLREWRAG